MREDSFHFRQFTIQQEKCAMKVGTDAVLLGSWIKASSSRKILDIGTGCGVIALMLAQKSPARIDAIDIDAGAVEQAERNFSESPWADRLTARCISFQSLAAHGHPYDLIVTNPPYFHHAPKPAVESRVNARHNEMLKFDELIDGALLLLRPDGRFCLILPVKEAKEFIEKSQRRHLFCNHLVRVLTKAGRPAKRFIMEFGFELCPVTEDEIIIHEEDGSFTKQYIELTKDYYIQLKSAPVDTQK